MPTLADSEPIALTVGHSTRPLAEFIVLKAYQVAQPADVRTVPRSRYNSRYGIENSLFVDVGGLDDLLKRLPQD